MGQSDIVIVGAGPAGMAAALALFSAVAMLFYYILMLLLRSRR